MAYSLLWRNKGARLHLIGLDLSASVLATIEMFAQENQFDIVHYNASVERLSHLISSDRLPAAVWCRLLLPELLPPDVERVVYLDCDTIVLCDISELGSLDLRGKPTALAPDPMPSDRKRDLLKGLELPVDDDYYNTGVMVMDLQQFRQQGLSEKIVEYAVRNPEKLQFMDQCAINVALHDDIFVIDSCYNAHPSWTELWTIHPKVLHFMGIKPWQSNRPLVNFIYNDARQKISNIEPLESSKIVNEYFVIWLIIKYVRNLIKRPFRREKRRVIYTEIRNYFHVFKYRFSLDFLVRGKT